MNKNQHKGPTVLVVEDNDLLRICAADILEEGGFDVVAASDAAEALELMNLHPEIRVLFTDIEMPGGLDGLQLSELVHRHWPRVLLLVTSGGVKPSQEEIPDSGRFLPKPYSAEQVVGELKELVDPILSTKGRR